MSYSNSSSDQEDSGDEYPRKRRRRTKSDQMLGVFGSDSEDKRFDKLQRKTLHNKSVQFSKAGHLSSDEDDNNLDIHLPFAQPDVSKANAPHMDTKESEKSLRSDKEIRFTASDIGNRPAMPTFGTYQNDIVTSAMVNDDSVPAQRYGSASTPRTKNAKSGPEAAQSTKLMSGKAAQMMARMGYKAGQGLGTTGSGIVNPIEAKLRPGQKAGLGSMNEKTDQELEEERRFGIKPEPKLPKRAIHAKAKTQKVKYKTVQEITADAGGGLPVPASLQTIVDMTGHPNKRITNMSDLSSRQESTEVNEIYKVSRLARLDLERNAADWRLLQDRKRYLLSELERNRTESATATAESILLEDLNKQVKGITISMDASHDDETVLHRLTNELESLQQKHSKQPFKAKMDEVAFAFLTPILKSVFSSWDVMASPLAHLDIIQRLAGILRITDMHDVDVASQPKRESLLIETFMATIWFPRILSNIASWSRSDSEIVLHMLQSWAFCTPPFLHEQLIDQLVMPRLDKGISDWHSRRSRSSLTWLFQWLPFLGDRVGELVAKIKRRFTIVLSHWKPADGLVEGLREWQELVGESEVDNMLQRLVVPKLADHLRKNVQIEPADQQLDQLDLILIWRKTLSPAMISSLLVSEFFPKWLSVLYAWLSENPNYEEISYWYEWWQEIISEDLLLEPSIREGFSKGLIMMNTTLDHGIQAVIPPQVGPALPLDHIEHTRSRKDKIRNDVAAPSSSVDEQEITFKDVIEDWCSKHNYLLLPLRKAHESGASLLRVTASPAGLGGATIYIRGDIVMLQDRQKGSFVPTSLDNLAAVLS